MRQALKGQVAALLLGALFLPGAAAESTELTVKAPLKVTGVTELEFASSWFGAWAPDGVDLDGDEFLLSADRIPFAVVTLHNYTSECTITDFGNPPTFFCDSQSGSGFVREDYDLNGSISGLSVSPRADFDEFVAVARLGDGSPEEAPVNRGLLSLTTGDEPSTSSLSAYESARFISPTSRDEIWTERSCDEVCRDHGIALRKNWPFVDMESGSASVSGGSRLYIFGGEVRFHDDKQPEGRIKTLVSGRSAYSEAQNGIPTRQVVSVTWITIDDRAGGYDIESRLPMKVFTGTSQLIHYKGLIDMKDPTGTAAINGNLTEFAGEDAQIGGEMTILGVSAGSHRSGGSALTLAVLNDAPPQLPETPPPLTEDEGFARGVVAATAATSSLGLAAYFWPRMKWLLTVPLIPLYTRIAKDEVLEHGKREEIYNLIREEPGIHAHEISSRAQIGWGTTVYHLRMLETNNLVTAQYSGRYKRFFANTGGFAATKDMYAALKNPTTAKIAQEILRNPGITQKEISKAIGITPSLVAWHIGKLEEASLVRRVKEGRLARHYAGDGWKTLNLQLPGTPIGDRSPPGERGAA